MEDCPFEDRNVCLHLCDCIIHVYGTVEEIGVCVHMLSEKYVFRPVYMTLGTTIHFPLLVLVQVFGCVVLIPASDTTLNAQVGIEIDRSLCTDPIQSKLFIRNRALLLPSSVPCTCIQLNFFITPVANIHKHKP